MEASASRPGPHLETLAPPISRIPSLARRRSHLDSNSYRTLVRIFSLCIDESHLHPQPPVSSIDTNPRLDVPPLKKLPKCSISVRHGNENDGAKLSKDPPRPNPRFVGAPGGNIDSVEELGHNGKCPGDSRDEILGEWRHGDGLKEHNLCHDGEVRNSPLSTNSELEQTKNEECADAEALLNSPVIDPTGPAGELDNILSSFEELLHEENNGLQKDAFVKKNEGIEDSLDIISSLFVDSKNQEQKDEIDGSFKELQDRETIQEKRTKVTKGIAFDKNITEGTQLEESQVMEERGRKQEKNIRSYSSIGHQDSPRTSLSNNGDVEEGEISDEAQVIDDPEEGMVGDSSVKQGNQDDTLDGFSNIGFEGKTSSRENNCKDEECNFQNNDKNDGIGRTYTYNNYSKAPIEEYNAGIKVNVKSQAVVTGRENFAIEKEGTPSKVKDVEGQVKKKRGVLTEERKAKKKSAKKRKRAEKDREQGVKRLKLQPIVKPKVVKHCNFFMVGRCQQGDLCKFSHDITPLTKSQPCTYFACNSCLKGEDCQFDHDLSKYPCHNYTFKGMCSRGDKCKFSHKMPIIEGSSVSKLDHPSSSGKQVNTNNSTNCPPKPSTFSAPFSMIKHVEASSVKCLNVPKGIRFLSFGKGSSEVTNKLLDNHGGTKLCNQEKQKKNALDSEQKTPFSSSMKLTGAIDSFTSKELKNQSFSTGPVVAPFSTSLQTEVSDATKILEEFLFIGDS